MVDKCVVFTNPQNYTELIFIFKSGFKGQYIVFYETATENSEFEYYNKKDLINIYKYKEEEINQL